MDFSRLAQDVLGQLGQVALQLHAAQDQQRGYAGSSRACLCGSRQKFVGHRPRTIETLLGTVSFTRAYYHCRDCGASCVPLDQAEGLGGLQVSVPLAQVVVELTDTLPFGQAQAKLSVLLGLSL